MWACLIYEAKGSMRYGGASPFYLTPQKRLSTEYSLRDAPCANTRRAHWRTYMHHMEHKLFRSLKPLN
jgi:hypothetical protein